MSSVTAARPLSSDSDAGFLCRDRWSGLPPATLSTPCRARTFTFHGVSTTPALHGKTPKGPGGSGWSRDLNLICLTCPETAESL